MAHPLIAYHADLLSFGATWALTAGAEDAEFPLTNLNKVYAHEVSKLTGTSGTYRGTIASTALQAIVIVNCNLAGLTLAVTNNGGMASQNLIIPAAAPDNVSLNGWVDLRAVTTAATQWNVAISGAAQAIAVGKILLVAPLREMMIRWDERPHRVSERKPTRVFRTEDQIALGYRRAVRYRTWMPELLRESQRSQYQTLRRGSEGPTQPFLFVLDPAVNDPAYVWFPEDTWEHGRRFANVTEWGDRLEEANPGLPLS